MVVSIDPRRVYLRSPDDVEFKAIKVKNLGERTVFVSYFTWICYQILTNNQTGSYASVGITIERMADILLSVAQC